jgi:hypothetical protein
MSLKELLSDSRSERLSVKHTAMMIATTTLSLCTTLLTILVYWRVEVVPALTAFGMTLGGIAGAGYTLGKPTERQKEQ